MNSWLMNGQYTCKVQTYIPIYFTKCLKFMSYENKLITFEYSISLFSMYLPYNYLGKFKIRIIYAVYRKVHSLYDIWGYLFRTPPRGNQIPYTFRTMLS